MKFLSLVATLSCTSLMTAFSLSASAEVNKDAVTDNLGTIDAELTIHRNYKHLNSNSQLFQHNFQNKEKSEGYSIYSLAKDKQIKLQDLQLRLALDNIDWYIEKF